MEQCIVFFSKNEQIYVWKPKEKKRFTKSIENFCRSIEKLVHTENVQSQLKTNLSIDHELNAFLISQSLNLCINKMSLVQKVLLRPSQNEKKIIQAINL